jgi:purine-cytosine permease-like protein
MRLRTRFGLFLASSILGLAGAATAAQAQTYPWCADYGEEMGGSSNCGFATFAQCMAALSGNGGFCNRNTQYMPFSSARGTEQRRRHRPRHS